MYKFFDIGSSNELLQEKTFWIYNYTYLIINII